MDPNKKINLSSHWEDKLDTIEKIFSYLYLKTNDSWLSYRSWEKSRGTNLWVSENEIASIFIPAPWEDNNTLRFEYTWNFVDLKNLLKWPNVELIEQDDISEKIAENMIAINIIWKERKILIVQGNLHNNLYNVFVVTPNWKELSIPWVTSAWIQDWVQESAKGIISSDKN